jgi:hypothetical protein
VTEPLSDSDMQTRRIHALDRLQAVRKWIDGGRLRDAENLLNELIATIADDPELEDLLSSAQSERPRIDARRSELGTVYKTQLDEWLNSPLALTERPFAEPLQIREYLDEARSLIDEAVDQRDQEMRALLAQWQQIIPEGRTDDAYQRRQNRVVYAISREKQRLYVGLARELCERIWAYADEQKAQRAAPITIVDIYKAAEDAANLALGRYPDDAQLKSLDTEARNRREREAVANQIKTSAVQEGEYDRALEDLSQFADDALIPDYNYLNVGGGVVSEQFTRRITAHEMRDQLERQALEWARAKRNEYIADAELALADHNPLAAENALSAERVTRLLRFLRQSTDRGDLQALQARIRDARRALDEAEKRAKEAQSRAASDPHDAWRVYGEARAEYEWAEALRETRSMIVAEFRQRAAARLETAQRLFEARRFTALNDEVAAINRQFRDLRPPLDDLLIQQQIDAANDLLRRAEEVERQKRALRGRLEQLERDLPNSDPDDLQAELDRLKNQYAEVLREDPRFDDIAQRVSLRQSVERQTEQFKQMLGEGDYARVEREVQKARAALGDYPDDAALRDAVRNLEVHLDYLSGKRELEGGQYARALEIFGRVQRMIGHPDRTDAAALYEEADQLIQEQQHAGDRLKRAEEQLTRAPVAVYEDLVQLGALSDRVLDKKRSNLLDRAKAEGKAVLLSQLREGKKPGAVPNADQIRAALDGLNTLGFTDEREEFARYYEPVLLGQQAGLLAALAARDNSASRWREVIALYEEAVSRARELNTESRLLREFEQNLQQARRASVQLQLESLRTRVASLSADAPELLDHFSQLETDLRAIFDANSGSGEVALWMAQLSELRARYSYNPEARLKWFRQAEAEGKRALGLLPPGAPTDTAQRLIRSAEQGAGLARVMLEIDADFAANTPERLRQAQTRWQQGLQPAALNADDDYFRPLRTWWNDRIKLHLGAANNRNDFIRPDGTLIVSRVVNRLLLDNDDATALSLVADLDTFVGQLMSKVESLVENHAAAQTVMGSDGMAKLAAQLSQFKETAADIEALANLVKYFGEAYDYSESIKNAYAHIGYENRALGETSEKLLLLQQQLSAARQQLSADQVTGTFTDSERLLSVVGPGLNTHPAAQQVRGEITAAQAERMRLLTEIDGIQAQINRGDYGSARRRMKAIGMKKAAEYGLATRLRIVHPKTGEVTNVWTEVENKLNELGGVLEAIIDFAAPFDEYQRIDGRIIGRLTGAAQPARVVLNWDAHAEKIKAALDVGSFADARQLVDEALNGSERLGIGLHAAVERLMRPPNGSGASVDARYSAAEAAASSSERARDLLRALQTERLTQFETQRAAAEEFRQRIDHCERQWSDGLESWASAIHAIAEQFQRAGGVNKRPRGQAMRTAIQSAWAAFDHCRQACPRHAYLPAMIDVAGWNGDNYQGLWLFRQAVKRARFAPLELSKREKAGA